MKIEKIKLAKSLKMALLLISSLLIATASAYIYSSLTMQSKIITDRNVSSKVNGGRMNIGWVARLR